MVDKKAIAKEMQRLATILSNDVECEAFKCKGCHYTDLLNPSETKRVKNTARGYFCKRCVSSMRDTNAINNRLEYMKVRLELNKQNA